MISDKTLICNLDILFENKVFLCGSKDYLRIAESLLQSIGINDYVMDESMDDCNNEAEEENQTYLYRILQKTQEEKGILIYCDIKNQMLLDRILKDDKGYDAGDSSPNAVSDTDAIPASQSIYTLMGLAFAIYENMEHEKIAWDLQIELAMDCDIQNAVRSQLSQTFIMQSVAQVVEKQISMLIYQPGKVGSTTLCNSLVAGGQEVYSIHGLNPRGRYLHLSQDQIPVCESYVAEIKKQVKQIITIIREPVSRDFASYFEGILCMDDQILIPQTEGKNPISSSYEYFLYLLEKNEGIDNKNTETSWYFNELGWYDDELKSVFGIDIYRYPFDKERGYSIIEENDISVLVLKAEQSQVWQEAVRQFTGQEDFVMLGNENTAAQKIYAHLYHEAKETMLLPQEYIDFYYKDNEKLKHFYTDAELDAFRKMWQEKVRR